MQEGDCGRVGETRKCAVATLPKVLHSPEEKRRRGGVEEKGRRKRGGEEEKRRRRGGEEEEKRRGGEEKRRRGEEEREEGEEERRRGEEEEKKRRRRGGEEEKRRRRGEEEKRRREKEEPTAEGLESLNLPIRSRTPYPLGHAAANRNKYMPRKVFECSYFVLGEPVRAQDSILHRHLVLVPTTTALVCVDIET